MTGTNEIKRSPRWADEITILVTDRGLRIFRDGYDVTRELHSFELKWSELAGSALTLEAKMPDHGLAITVTRCDESGNPIADDGAGGGE